MNKNRLFILIILSVFVVNSLGCEAFRKKFIRKKKPRPKEEMIIYPKDYSKDQLPSDRAYQQYYTYWKAWHEELLNHLHVNASRKRILNCFEQTILNLNRMEKLLANEEKIKKLQGYIDNIETLEQEVKGKNFQIVSFTRLKHVLGLLSRDIQRGFAFSKIKDDIKW